ncbi:unnamed protein product [Cladocopium goreaui]|uniref:Uncharacterized protein n=1 Tax=Cladocopium goreaui TaxID=2562237 RepID=A0A9P1C7S7_9DINO|nr:unnamed protein product [Cladocopium goreaui]
MAGDGAGDAGVQLFDIEAFSYRSFFLGGLLVACLTSEGFSLRVDPAMLGREVYLRISQRLLPRAGAKLLIASAPAERLQMRQSLQQQGIVTWTWAPRSHRPGSCF